MFLPSKRALASLKLEPCAKEKNGTPESELKRKKEVQVFQIPDLNEYMTELVTSLNRAPIANPFRRTQVLDQALFEWSKASTMVDFEEQLGFLMQSVYPSEKKSMLDYALVFYCLRYPEWQYCVTKNLVKNLKNDGSIKYNKRLSPFYAFMGLFNSENYNADNENIDKRKTIYSLAMFLHTFMMSDNPKVSLAFITDCLVAAPTELREVLFKLLLMSTAEDPKYPPIWLDIFQEENQRYKKDNILQAAGKIILHEQMFFNDSWNGVLRDYFLGIWNTERMLSMLAIIEDCLKKEKMVALVHRLSLLSKLYGDTVFPVNVWFFDHVIASTVELSTPSYEDAVRQFLKYLCENEETTMNLFGENNNFQSNIAKFISIAQKNNYFCQIYSSVWEETALLNVFSPYQWSMLLEFAAAYGKLNETFRTCTEKLFVLQLEKITGWDYLDSTSKILTQLIDHFFENCPPKQYALVDLFLIMAYKKGFLGKLIHKWQRLMDHYQDLDFSRSENRESSKRLQRFIKLLKFSISQPHHENLYQQLSLSNKFLRSLFKIAISSDPKTQYNALSLAKELVKLISDIGAINFDIADFLELLYEENVIGAETLRLLLETCRNRRNAEIIMSHLSAHRSLHQLAHTKYGAYLTSQIIMNHPDIYT